MGTPNPGARGDTGIGTRLNKSEKDLAQLRRLIENPPKTKAAAPAGGAVNGVTRVSCWTMLIDRDVAAASAFPTDLELQELSGEPQGVTLTTPDEFGRSDLSIATAGFYLVKMDAWLAFQPGDPATYVEFYVDHTGSSYHFPRLRVPVTPDFLGGTSGPDAVASWTCAALAIPAAATLSFGARFIDPSSTPAVNYWSVDVSRVG